MGSSREMAIDFCDINIRIFEEVTELSQKSGSPCDSIILQNAIRNISVAISGNIGLNPNRTISAQAAEARMDGLAWGAQVCAILDAICPDHCDQALQNERGTVRSSILSLGRRWGLQPVFAQSLWLLNENWVSAGNISILGLIVSGIRDPEHQRILQERWDRGDRAGLVARPAVHSRHTVGMAVDIGGLRMDQYRALARIWMSFGRDHRWGGSFREPDPVHYDIA